MASVKTVLRKTILADGTHPIYLRVTMHRRTKYFKTLYNVNKDNWNKELGNFNKRNPNYIQFNRLLLNLRDRALRILSELQIDDPDFTLEDFEKQFRIINNPESHNFFRFWEEIIGEQLDAGRTGTARANTCTYHSFKSFHKHTRLSFRELTPRLLHKYEVYLRTRGGTDGGIGVRMRSIRAIYNQGINRGLVKEKYYPFKKYKISRFKSSGFKRALTMQEVFRIVNLDLTDHPFLINSRNYFVFSFYTRGMNFADMMKLRWADISNNRIYYTRSKTRSNFIIKILPPIKEILDYYKENDNGLPYVFPLIVNAEYTPAQLENRKHKTIQRYNKELKEIGKLCGIVGKPMSSYVARHSYANCLKQKGVPTDIISESMGHQNLVITQTYLKALDSSHLDNAMEVLLQPKRTIYPNLRIC
ncbi:site-specific integrase [Croceitalea sp. MTPC9]|uniref:site-specific integrase n=1 Tax=unclassified Croceitalea TaxID=2632280 RepID=UPI002B3B4FAE|nr:site-specific integrase [Croceitalea sp. MTPC6]GMN16673.1 site-specific integrase [Croceitalea sp. MTPC9]